MTAKLVAESSGALTPPSEDIIKKHREEGWLNLEPHKRAFAISYVQSNSYVQAAKDIKKPGMGARYLRDPLVKALIADLQKEMFEVSLINRQFVEQKMIETLEKLEGNESVPMVTGQGIAIKEKKFHSGEVVNLLKEMGKISGIIPEKEVAAGGVQVTINMGALLGEDNGGTVIDNSPK